MKKSMNLLPALLVLTIAVSCAPPSQRTTGSQSDPGTTKPVTTQSSQAAQTIAVNPEPPEEAKITFEKIAVIGNQDELSWHEITDPTIIAQISKVIPDSPGYLAKSAENNGEIFQAVIPLEIDQNTSSEISDILQGLIKDPALMQKYAKLFKSDVSKITSPASYLAVLPEMYKLAMLLVADFVLSESSTELENMDAEIQKISEFQDQEFKSKILTAHSEVKELSKFTSEILEKEEVRTRKLVALETLKSNVMQLLNQVNGTISKTAVNSKIEFTQYVKKIDEEVVLIDHQRILINILEEISNLMFIFDKGDSSSDMNFSTYNEYLQKSNEARMVLSQWHDVQITAFGIDLASKKFTKQGFEGIVSVIPGVFNKDWTKKELDDAFVQKITVQSQKPAFITGEPRFLNGNNIKIIIMNGKYYYIQAKKA